MDTIQQQKAALRRELAAAERAMMPEEKRLSDGAILRHVLNTQEYRLARTVFAFVGRADEIDTRPLLEQILADGNGCACRCVPPPASWNAVRCLTWPCFAPALTVFRSRRTMRRQYRRNASIWPSSPAPARLWMAAGLGAAAVTTTDFWPGIPATRCCCAGKGFCVRTFRRKHTISASPLL